MFWRCGTERQNKGKEWTFRDSKIPVLFFPTQQINCTFAKCRNLMRTKFILPRTFLMDKLITHTDARGCLTIVEALKDFPFTIDRAYWLHSVPEGAERGYHASRSCYEYLVSMCGSVEIVLEDAKGRQIYVLSKKDEGLLVPPYTWIELKQFSPDAVLLVLASDGYQPESYINDYDEFLKEIL